MPKHKWRTKILRIIYFFNQYSTLLFQRDRRIIFSALIFTFNLNITKYSIKSYILFQHKYYPSIQKCKGKHFSPPNFYPMYNFSQSVQLRVVWSSVVKHDRISSVKEENILCKNQTDKHLCFLCISGWWWFTMYPFVKRKRS